MAVDLEPDGATPAGPARRPHRLPRGMAGRRVRRNVSLLDARPRARRPRRPHLLREPRQPDALLALDARRRPDLSAGHRRDDRHAPGPVPTLRRDRRAVSGGVLLGPADRFHTAPRHLVRDRPRVRGRDGRARRHRAHRVLDGGRRPRSRPGVLRGRPLLPHQRLADVHEDPPARLDPVHRDRHAAGRSAGTRRRHPRRVLRRPAGARQAAPRCAGHGCDGPPVRHGDRLHGAGYRPDHGHVVHRAPAVALAPPGVLITASATVPPNPLARGGRGVTFGGLMPHFGAHAGPARVLEGAGHVERLGFDAAWCRDHLLWHPHGHEAGGDVTFLEPLVTLSAIGALTKRIVVGTSVLIPVRSPLRLAQEYATLAHLTGGRVILGIGAGHEVDELVAAGVDPARRRQTVTETVEIVRRLWADDHVTYAGEIFSIDDVTIRPKPPASIPILFGGPSRYAVRLAGQHCDGWIAGIIPLDTLDARLAELRDHSDRFEESLELIAERVLPEVRAATAAPSA